MTAREPMAPTPVWHAVVTAAGQQCQCTGTCGRPHTKTGGRCPAGEGQVLPVRLFVAPQDPALPAARACRLPARQLAAWCGPCLDGTTRHARPRTVPVAEASEQLFALPDG